MVFQLAVSACGRFGFGAPQASETCAPSEVFRHNDVGGGTVDDPYELCSAAQWQDLTRSQLSWDRHYIVTADLDLAGVDGYVPIGTEASPFTGTIDGNGHSISNLSLSDSTALDFGLFGYVSGPSAIVVSIHVVAAILSGDHNVGALVGRLRHGARVSNCSATGEVSGTSSVGGLVGRATTGAIVSTSSAEVEVSGTNFVGGLVGSTFHGARVENSRALGRVMGGDRAGGLIGAHCQGCVAINVFATGRVNGDDRVGGLIGEGWWGQRVHNAFTVGDVSCNSASDDCGLLGGFLVGDIQNTYFDSDGVCTNAGTGTCFDNTDGMGVALGGSADHFFGSINEPIASWPLASSWTTLPDGLPRPSAVLADVDEWGTCADHQMDVPFAGGVGTAEDPYLICTPAQMQAIGADSSIWSSHFRLMSDLDLSAMIGTEYNIPGQESRRFGGVFDGNGHTISGFTYNDAARDGVGLFGFASYATIKRVAVHDVQLVGNDGVGALVGQASETLVLASYTTGQVRGNQYVGGIGGRVNWIYNSYSLASVTGVTSVGGLVGGVNYSWPALRHSFATGDVIGGAGQVEIGRLVGIMDQGGLDHGYFDAGSTCEACDNALGIGRDVQGVDAGWFFDARNQPYVDDWDFVRTWQENDGDYPTLR